MLQPHVRILNIFIFSDIKIAMSKFVIVLVDDSIKNVGIGRDQQ